ncbi:MAG: M28 family peptidase [Myxococcota bacterium]
MNALLLALVLGAQSPHTLLEELTDTVGARLAGTPAYERSVNWAEKKFRAWGLENIQRHPFRPDHIGWSSGRFHVRLTEPQHKMLQVQPIAWSKPIPATEGPVVVIKRRADLEARDDLQGAIVFIDLFGSPDDLVSRILSRRLDDEVLGRARDNPDPNDLIIGYHIRRPTMQAITRRSEAAKRFEPWNEVVRRKGIAALVAPSSYPNGILRTDSILFPILADRDGPRLPPTFIMARDEFAWVTRRVEAGAKVEVALDAQFHDRTEANVSLSADVIGTEKPNEYVILSAHLDSWHTGTGAIDNGSGVVAMMGAIREIAKKRPKRTVRLILWGGHEVGFLGSHAYVSKNVGTLDGKSKGPLLNRVSALLNLDNGAGRIRGLYLNGSTAVRDVLAPLVTDFEGDGVLTLQYANQSDHELFDVHNIPAFQFIQDPLDYISVVHHTQRDRISHAPPEDLAHNAQYVATLARRIADLPKKLPRRPHVSILPSLIGAEEFSVTFPDAQSVSLVADFNQWNMFGTPMARKGDRWVTRLDLPPGKYVYKFIVDGMWTNDPSTPKDELVKDGKGHGGLTVRVVR